LRGEQSNREVCSSLDAWLFVLTLFPGIWTKLRSRAVTGLKVSRAKNVIEKFELNVEQVLSE
jgi:hypothetical protein